MTAAPRFAALDGLRGFAVLLVFCVHAAGNAASVALGRDFATARYASVEGATEQALFWLFRSHHGVFLFFVLSGFLIGRMWWPRAALPAATFLWRRTLRIYPAFLLAFVGSLVFARASGTWTPPDWPRLLGNLVFANGWPQAQVGALNIVTWSLFYEFTFYLAFPLVAFAAYALRSATAAAVLGVALPLAAAMLGADPIVLCWSLLFAGAALAASPGLAAACQRVPAAVVVAAYLVVTTLGMLDAMPPIVGIAGFGAAAILLVAHCLASDHVLAATFAWSPLRALGRVSYSFYLWHWMIVVLVARAVQAAGWPPLAMAVTIFTGGFVLSYLAATLSWRIAERPYLVRVKDPRA